MRRDLRRQDQICTLPADTFNFSTIHWCRFRGFRRRKLRFTGSIAHAQLWALTTGLFPIANTPLSSAELRDCAGGPLAQLCQMVIFKPLHRHSPQSQWLRWSRGLDFGCSASMATFSGFSRALGRVRYEKGGCPCSFPAPSPPVPQWVYHPQLRVSLGPPPKSSIFFPDALLQIFGILWQIFTKKVLFLADFEGYFFSTRLFLIGQLRSP